MVREVVVAIIITPDGEFLLQKKTLDYPICPGKWFLFGGGVEGAESLIDALKRELKEELGLEFSQISFFGENVFDFIKEYIFVVKFDGEIQDIKLSEGAGFAFFSKEELGSLNIFKEAKKNIDKYLNKNIN